MTEFKTYITFNGDGGSHTENTTKENLSSTIARLMRGPAAQMGMIKEVKIVDMMDCIVFLAKDNKVVYPPREK